VTFVERQQSLRGASVLHGENARKVRDKVSLHEIAKRTGLSRNTVRIWLRELGELQAPVSSRAPVFNQLGEHPRTGGRSHCHTWSAVPDMDRSGLGRPDRCQPALTSVPVLDY
jgi:hypothetical protein